MENDGDKKEKKLAVTSNVPAAGAWSRLLAMTRDPTSLVIGETPVTLPVELTSMPKAVHVAVIDADVAGSLLKVVKGVFAPRMLRNAAWPESVRDDLAAHAHRYLAGLTERTHELRGETVLYVPDEPGLANVRDPCGDETEAAADERAA